MPYNIVVKWLCILAFEMNFFSVIKHLLLEFVVSILLTVTELGRSEIVSMKLMFPMSSIGYFNFYMWTVNIYVEVNFTGCTKSPTVYVRESNQYPCHLWKPQKRASCEKS